MTAIIRNPHAQTLCKLALDDESALQYPLPDQIFGFLAQQSCEKLFKALITSRNVPYPLTHNLQKLADLLLDVQESVPIPSSTLRQLQPFAVELRYDVGAALSEQERLALRESIATLREHVVARILELEQGLNP